MSKKDKIIKRAFDLVLATLLTPFLLPIIAISWLIAAIETRSNGFFIQKRVGENGKLFNIIKIKTIYPKTDKVTKSGRFFRKYKIDEFPQIFNILKGDMSFVGPRPDLPGYADKLKGEDRIILSTKPGLTGPASLIYKDEEEILKRVKNKKEYNDKIIWPHKVKINKEYIKNWSLKRDIYYILKTIKEVL